MLVKLTCVTWVLLPAVLQVILKTLHQLREQKVLVVQGTGFNWPDTDHIRIVFLPNSDDLTEAIGRIARFCAAYRKRHGTG